MSPRLLHVIPSLAPSSGGPTVAILEMCRHLADAGVAVDIATTDAGISASKGEASDPFSGSVPVRMFHAPILGKYGYSPRLKHWLRANVRNYDVVHVHGIFNYTSRLAAIYAERAGVPYVLRPVGQLDRWSFGSGSAFKRFFWRFFGRPLCARAASLHVTSEIERQAASERAPGVRTALVPLGVDVVGDGPKDVRRPWGPPFELLFLSRIHPHKNIELLLEVIRELKTNCVDVHLTVAGSGSRGYLQQVFSRVKDLELDDQVSFVGFLDEVAKLAALHASDIFVLPSHGENFGVAVAEAMAVGLPVVVSDQVGLAPLVERSGAGVIVEGFSISSWVQAIRSIVEDGSKASRMGLDGYSAAKNELSWGRSASELVTVYEQAAGA